MTGWVEEGIILSWWSCERWRSCAGCQRDLNQWQP